MADSVVVRCEGEQAERLERMARRLGCTPAEAGAMLIEEGLREAEFPHIDFRGFSRDGRPTCAARGWPCGRS